MQKRFFICIIIFLSTAHAYADQAMPFLAEVKVENVNLRAGQSTNFENLERLTKGEQLVVVDKSFSWYKVKLPLTAKAFVSSSLVNMVRGEVGEIKGNRVNVRAQPKLDATVLGQLSKGTLVRVVEIIDGGWYRIDPPDQTYGWLLAEYVTFLSNAIPPPHLVEAPSRNIYRQKKNPEPVAEQTVSLQPQVNLVVVQGVVEDLGQGSPSPDIRHKIQVDKTVYCLKGYRSILDAFLHNRVKIEGKLEPQGHSPYPVILVTKISLVL